jgi:hypothetical protein
MKVFPSILIFPCQTIRYLFRFRWTVNRHDHDRTVPDQDENGPTRVGRAASRARSAQVRSR